MFNCFLVCFVVFLYSIYIIALTSKPAYKLIKLIFNSSGQQYKTFSQSSSTHGLLNYSSQIWSYVIILAVCDFNRPQHCSSTTFVYFRGYLYQSFVKLTVFNSCIFRKLFLSVYLQRTKLLLSKFPQKSISHYIYSLGDLLHSNGLLGQIFFFFTLIFGHVTNVTILDNSCLMKTYYLVLSTKPQLIARNRLLHYSIILACSVSNPF